MRAGSARPPVLVVAAALVDDLIAPGQVLAARRAYPPALAGRWEFPGGKVTPGEAPVAALHRELEEELGIEAVLGAEVTGPDGAWPLGEGDRLRLWLARVTGGTPTPRGAHDRVGWVELPALHELAWLSPDEPMVAALQSRFQSDQARISPAAETGRPAARAVESRRR